MTLLAEKENHNVAIIITDRRHDYHTFRRPISRQKAITAALVIGFERATWRFITVLIVLLML